MEISWLHRTDALILCIMLFFAMLIMVWLGRMAGKLWHKDDPEPKGGVNSLLAAVFGLFGFILAFTFGMSGNRYESVRTVIVNEANDIGTAILRADLYPDSARTALRAEFRKYLEARISYYQNATNLELWKKAKEDAAVASSNLWAIAIAQSKKPNMLIPSNSMIPALNSMFDIATSNEMLLLMRVPDLIIYMLFILALASSFIAGFTSEPIRPKHWIVITGFALLSSMIIYITLDLGRPLRGIIKTNVSEQSIVDLRKMF